MCHPSLIQATDLANERYDMKNATQDRVQIICDGSTVVYKYDDKFYSYENYLPKFTTLIECLTWGYAMDKAIKQRSDALEQIKALECWTTIVTE
jgi:hypothetical protein